MGIDISLKGVIMKMVYKKSVLFVVLVLAIVIGFMPAFSAAYASQEPRRQKRMTRVLKLYSQGNVQACLFRQ